MTHVSRALALVSIAPLFIGLPSTLAFSGEQDPPSLRSEVVTLRIVPGNLEVTGQYEFGMDSRDKLEILYPIPEDGGLGPAQIKSATIRRGSRIRRLSLRSTDLGTSWTIPAGPGHCTVVICYRQEMRGSRAEYALVTARGWSRPIERARFVVMLPTGYSITRASYPFQVKSRTASMTTYAHEEVDFVPDRDLVLEWTTSPDSRW